MATQTKKKKPGLFKRMGAWLGRSWAEFRKVTWPSAGTVFKNLGIVLVVVLFFLITIGLADWLFSWLLGLLVG
jgi:preprotein translocase subunit SecE